MKKLISTLLIFIALFASSPKPSYAATDIVNDGTLSTNLISCWELDETSGTRVDAANGNDLTDNNTVLSATGIQGNAADFVAANSEYLSITDASQTGLDITGDFWTSSWVNLTSLPSSNEYAIFSKDDVTNRSYYQFVDVDEKLVIFFQDGSGNSSRFRTNAAVIGGTGSTTNIVAQVDVSAPSATVWVNGTSVTVNTELSAATSIRNSTANFEVGRFGQGNRYMDGWIDVLSIWTGTTTQSKVNSVYNSGSGIPCDAGVVAAPEYQPLIWF